MSEAHPSWWDPYSNQPHVLSSSDKPRSGLANLNEYAKVAATSAMLLPALLWRFACLRSLKSTLDAKSFMGLGVSPSVEFNNGISEMVDELQVQHLLLRVPTWEIAELDRYVDFAKQFAGKTILINVLQSRESVTHPGQWLDRVRQIFTAFSGITNTFQIGNAINRSKWGCHHSGEYFGLLDAAQQLRAEFPDIDLIGSSVIDFEPMVTLRTLFNRRTYHLDAVSALLYVNRRGSPYGRQFKIFDLRNKLRLIYAMVLTGNRNAKRLWITEVNWPLLNTEPYMPNSGHPSRTVDEPTQAEYLKQYYQIAHATGWVERVYWWQLINPGYGLVDHRGGRLRKHPAYRAFKELLDGGLAR